MNAATGNAAVIAQGLELFWGEPAPSYVAYDLVPPLGIGMKGSIIPSPAVNRFGQKLKGSGGAKTGDAELTLELHPSILHEYFHHLIGDYSEVELETGVYEGTFSPPLWADRVETSFSSLWGKEPVERRRDLGIRYGQIEIPVGENAIGTAKLTGSIAHSSSWSDAAPDAGNLGSYTGGPWLRGPLGDTAAGDHIHLRVSRDVGGGGVRFQVYHGGAVPDFTGAPEIDVAYDSSGRARWVPIQDQVGLDLGIITNKVWDPIEAIFPGTSTDLAALQINDIFTFQASWPMPALGTFAGSGAFTGFHLKATWRRAGSGAAFQEFETKDSTITISNPISVQPGRTYPSRIHREGPLMIEASLKRAYTDRELVDLFDAQTPIELILEFAGRQIGAAPNRELIRMRMPYAVLSEAASPVGGTGIVDEDVKVEGHYDPDTGDPALEVVTVSERTWTAPT